MSILPLVSGPKTPTAAFVASSAAWTERSRARKSVPNTAGSRLSHVDVLAFVEGSRRAGGSVARGVLADPLPGGRGAHRGPDAPWEPGAELVLQHLGRHRRLSPRPDGAVHLAFGVLGGDRLALVVLPLAPGEPDLELDPVARPVEAEWHEGQALLLDGDTEPDDLAFVQQQFPFTLCLVIATVTPLIGTDVDVDQEGFALTEAHIALAQVGAALAQRLDLGADQLNAGLDRLQDEIVMEGDAVGRDRGVFVGLLLSHQRRPRAQAAALMTRPPGGCTSSTT